VANKDELLDVHALGSCIWGFTQEVFDTSQTSVRLDPHEQADMIREMAATYPHIVEVAMGLP
jgi:hypothetical protein